MVSVGSDVVRTAAVATSPSSSLMLVAAWATDCDPGVADVLLTIPRDWKPAANADADGRVPRYIDPASTLVDANDGGPRRERVDRMTGVKRESMVGAGGGVVQDGGGRRRWV